MIIVGLRPEEREANQQAPRRNVRRSLRERCAMRLGARVLFFEYSNRHMNDTDFMMLAIEEARAAGVAEEVPIGAVLVSDGKIVGRGGNRTIRDCDPTAHAEIIALREAAKREGNYRLSGTTLYVTLEPCAMCAGAIIQARVTRVVYGADDPKGGAVRTCFEVLTHPKLNHRVEITAGILGPESAALLQKFFTARR
jgi:tRNA(adenine34) deaminase